MQMSGQTSFIREQLDNEKTARDTVRLQIDLDPPTPDSGRHRLNVRWARMNVRGLGRRYWRQILLLVGSGFVIAAGLGAIVIIYAPTNVNRTESVAGGASRAGPQSRSVPASPAAESLKSIPRALPSGAGYRPKPQPSKSHSNNGDSWIPPFLRRWLQPAG
jgi:hypothetical protein